MSRVDHTMTIPDGGTVLIGGLKSMSEGGKESGPPVLSKIPYVSRLFKTAGYVHECDNVVLLVTPRIVVDREEEKRAVAGVPTSSVVQASVRVLSEVAEEQDKPAGKNKTEPGCCPLT